MTGWKRIEGLLLGGAEPQRVIPEVRNARLVFFSILLRWSHIIGVLLAATLWVATVYRGEGQIVVMAAGFTAFSAALWGCALLLRRGVLQATVRWYLLCTVSIVVLYQVLMPEAQYLMALVGFVMFTRLVAFFEGSREAVAAGIAFSILFLGAAILRRTWVQPIGPFEGVVDRVVSYLLPVLVLMMFTLIDRAFSQHLLLALEEAQDSRTVLEQQNLALVEQKRDLEAQERELAAVVVDRERTNEELRAANEEIKSFAYLISHDLRSPLVNLRGFSNELRLSLARLDASLREGVADGARREMDQLMEGEIDQSLHFIDASVEKMDGYIKAVLRLSRAGRRELEIVPVDTEDLVHASLQALRHEIDRRSVEIDLGPLPTVVSDRISLEQIFGNLLDNAVRYLAPDRPGRVSVRCRSGVEGHRFTVADNGRGMRPDEIPRAFEPFQRIGRPERPGEGMGLAYVRSLVRRLGGRVAATSSPGRGTTFSLVLPDLGEENR